MFVTRTCKLVIYPRARKLEGARYTYERHLKYVQHWVTQLYFNRSVNHLSTSGMGNLANQAQKTAREIIKRHLASGKATGNKSNVPLISQIGCRAKIEKSKNKGFDYWIYVEDSFKRVGRIQIPVKGHKRLNHWLSLGYELNPIAELCKDKNGKFYAIVFIQKEVAKATPKHVVLGVDVGITHSVSRSDGYLGIGCKDILLKARNANAERRRQGQYTKSIKTFMKQKLDIEAKRAVRVAQARGWSLAFEDPKVLANLKPSGRVAQWAKSYFANRATVLAQEQSVFVVSIYPSYTSQTCFKCGHRDSLSRVKSVFHCTACGNRTHADINAGRVIAQKGSENVLRIMNHKYKSGSVS